MRRPIGIALALCAFAAGVFMLRPWYRGELQTEAQEFWQKFATVHSAWLDPAPPAMRYELLVQESGPPFAGEARDSQAWRDRAVVRAWYRPDDSVRCAAAFQDPALQDFDHRYCRGKGIEFPLASRPRAVPLEEDLLMAVRTGAGMYCSLHRFASEGLRGRATLRRAGGETITLTVTQPPSAHYRYCLYPSCDARGVQSHPCRVELAVASKTMLPLGLTECSRTGQVGRMRFEGWLMLKDKPVPRTLIVSGAGGEIVYRFGIRSGAWLLEEALCKPDGEGNCSRSLLRNLQCTEIPEEVFEPATTTPADAGPGA